MIERGHIEKILSVNGIAPTAADEEIRSVLISARWHKEDVETALTVLRENVTTKQSRVDTLHNVFRSDARLSPEAIHSLLGIDVEMSSSEIATIREQRQHISYWQVFSILVFATILAFGSILTVMFVENFGFFHPGL